MAERATVFENVQIGREATGARGTPVAADRLLRSLGITFSAALTSRRIRPMGSKLDTKVAPGRRSSEGAIEASAASFEEACIVHESLFGTVAPSTPDGATTAQERSYGMDPRGPDTYQSYTVERGSSAGASRVTHGVFSGMTMNGTTEEVTIAGNLIGQKVERGITMTADPTALPLTVMDPLAVLITVDDTFAAIGTTAMERVLSWTYSVNDKYGPLWVVNRLNAGTWPTVVERPVDATLGLVLASDSQSNDFLDMFEAGDIAYVRIEILGPEIETDLPYLFQADFAASVENLSEGDQDDVWADTWGLRLVDDDPNIPGVTTLIRNAEATL